LNESKHLPLDSGGETKIFFIRKGLTGKVFVIEKTVGTFAKKKTSA
jgi:hypothetical protein